MGAEGVEVRNLGDVGEALQKAWRAQKKGKTAILDVHVTMELGDPFAAMRSKSPSACSRNTSTPTWRDLSSRCLSRGSGHPCDGASWSTDPGHKVGMTLTVK